MTDNELANAIMQHLDDRDRTTILTKHDWCVKEIPTWTLLNTLIWLLRDGVYHERAQQDLTNKINAFLNTPEGTPL